MSDENYVNSFRTADNYAKYLDHDLDKKLIPLNLLINGMKARLDQCQTVVSISHDNVEESTKALSSLSYCKDQLDDLCSKIDTVEKVVDHIKSNLANLEDEIEKAEQKLGLNNDNLVVNILNPLLFRKGGEKRNIIVDVPQFDPSEYFIPEKSENEEL
ncbi:uncharacterized protein LOC123674000 [Harmonia axyridis]|uniref:uncharacterized protein LOC123674000 n=1 Tax=Harmonia axyridis TaxID=115357 RepID=UPI001E2753AB|nr:uncharacterized protein LOC123674000 [Harmonia axyridis]